MLVTVFKTGFWQFWSLTSSISQHNRRVPTSKRCHNDLNYVTYMLKLSPTLSHQHHNVTNMTVAMTPLPDTRLNVSDKSVNEVFVVKNRGRGTRMTVMGRKRTLKGGNSSASRTDSDGRPMWHLNRFEWRYDDLITRQQSWVHFNVIYRWIHNYVFEYINNIFIIIYSNKTIQSQV